MVICLNTHLPIAKKLWRIFCVEKDTSLSDVIDDAIMNMPRLIDKMLEWRATHPRAFKKLPPYLKFFIMENGDPRKVPGQKLGAFVIHLDGMRPEILEPWD